MDTIRQFTLKLSLNYQKTLLFPLLIIQFYRLLSTASSVLIPTKHSAWNLSLLLCKNVFGLLSLELLTTIEGFPEFEPLSAISMM